MKKVLFSLLFVSGLAFGMEAPPAIAQMQGGYASVLSDIKQKMEHEDKTWVSDLENLAPGALAEFGNYVKNQTNIKLSKRQKDQIASAIETVKDQWTLMPEELRHMIAEKIFESIPYSSQLGPIINLTIQEIKDTSFPYVTMGDEERFQQTNIQRLGKMLVGNTAQGFKLINQDTNEVILVRNREYSTINGNRFMVGDVYSLNLTPDNPYWVLIGGQRGEIGVYDVKNKKYIVAYRYSPQGAWQIAPFILKVSLENGVLKAYFGDRPVVKEIIFKERIVSKFPKVQGLIIDQALLIQALVTAAQQQQKINLTPMQKALFDNLPEWYKNQFGTVVRYVAPRSSARAH